MKKKALKKGMRRFLHLIQHLLIVAAAVAILIVLTGSSVMLEGVEGNYSYSMRADEKGKVYEDSLLFNHIFGRGVTDVARMGAVKSQMETDGKFNGDKIIDVTTFCYRYDILPNKYVTAKYRLEDLIKWAQYGFETEERYLTGQEADDFLSRMTTYTRVNYTMGGLQGSIVTPFNSNMEEQTDSYSVSANELTNGEGFYRDDTSAAILLNRYKTVEGKNIEDYTGTWNDYYELCDYVKIAAESLNDNYEEYLEYKKFYQTDHSNLRYYIIKTIGDRTEVYSNLNETDLSEKEITQKFKDYGKYLYFSPSEMKYNTNSLISEDTVRHVFNAYEYAYPETIKVWIGADTTYPVRDVYTQGLDGYRSYMPYYWQLIILAAAALIVYLFLYLYLTYTEGREKDEEGNLIIALRPIDRIPTEISVIGAILIIGGIIIALTYVYDSMSFEYYYTTWFKAAAAAVVLICELLFTGFYYSMVRRLKADNLWKESLTYKGIAKGKKAAWKFYDNGTVIVKSWGIFAVFVALNILLPLLGNVIFNKTFWIFLLICIDAAFGVIIYRNAKNRQRITEGIEKIKEGNLKYKVDENGLHGDNLLLAQSVNSIGEGIRTAVETSMKDERLKADLITNVSHDIKTPLTSIINYIDLIKRENIENEKVKSYVAVLDIKSQRLKQLTDDLVEASKISSGNISLEWERINLVELVNQTLGEFSEKFDQKTLLPILNIVSPNMYIEADSRRIWRVMENLFNNIFKYALEGTRVYVDMSEAAGEDGRKQVIFAIKNISAQPLNLNADELTERFMRGDVARSTEGSGLGLSIAKNLTEAQNGKFEIQLDGDLFKVILTFPLLET